MRLPWTISKGLVGRASGPVSLNRALALTEGDEGDIQRAEVAQIGPELLQQFHFGRRWQGVNSVFPTVQAAELHAVTDLLHDGI